MCTLVILFQVHASLPVIIAANRDEYHHRQAEPPRRRGNVLAGRDVPSGGTWLGVNTNGFFVGITNQRTGRFAKAAPESRGMVVERALHAGDADAVLAQLRDHEPKSTNPFNLVFGNHERLWAAYCHEGDIAVRIEELQPGLQVMPNGPLDAAEFTKVAHAKSMIEGHVRKPWTDLRERLCDVLGDHRKPLIPTPRPEGSLMPDALRRRLDAMCVHAGPYGTRSASIVALREGSVMQYLHADGPPCQTRFADYTTAVMRSVKVTA